LSLSQSRHNCDSCHQLQVKCNCQKFIFLLDHFFRDKEMMYGTLFSHYSFLLLHMCTPKTSITYPSIYFVFSPNKSTPYLFFICVWDSTIHYSMLIKLFIWSTVPTYWSFIKEVNLFFFFLWRKAGCDITLLNNSFLLPLDYVSLLNFL